MSFDPVTVVAWHNARPNAIQINVADVVATSLAVPYWRASTKARCRFRVKVGEYSPQAAMLAQSRYQTALAEYTIRLNQWQRSKDEEERRNLHEKHITSGLSSLLSAVSRPQAPNPPAPEESAEFHWSNTLSASIHVDARQPGCRPKSVMPAPPDNLFDWVTVHSSSSALNGHGAERSDIDAPLIQKYVAEFITKAQTDAIKARIAAERYQFVGGYETLGIDYDVDPDIEWCHVWRVTLASNGKKAVLLVGSDGQIFGRPMTFASKATKIMTASVIALAGAGGIWVTVSKFAPAPQAAAAAPESARVDAPVAPRVATVAAAQPRPAIVTPTGSPPPTAVENSSTPKIIATAPPESTATAGAESGALPTVAKSGGVEAARAQSDATKIIDDILTAARGRDWAGIDQQTTTLKTSFVAPPRGDRKVARAANTEALALLTKGQFDEAAKILGGAFAADPSDLEILNNLGYANILAGHFSNGMEYIAAAILRSPDRTSAWANLSEALAGMGQEPLAVQAMTVAVLFSASREKTTDYLTGIRDKHSSEKFREVARLTLEQIDTVPVRGPAGQMALPSPLPDAKKVVATE